MKGNVIRLIFVTCLVFFALSMSSVAQLNSLPTTCVPGGLNDTVTLQAPGGAQSPSTPSGLWKCTAINQFTFFGSTTGNALVGATPIGGSITFTGLSATQSGTLAASALPGLYSVSMYLDQIAACATGTGTVVVTFTYTDDVGSRTTANQTLTMTTTPASNAPVQVTLVMWNNAAANITYTSTYTACTTGTGTYSLRAVAEKVL